MNQMANKINKSPSEITLAKVFKTAVLNKPSLIIDVMRMFSGF